MWIWYSSFSSVLFIPDIRFGCADHPVNTPPFSLHNLPCRLFISTPYIHPTSPTCCIFVPHSCSALLSSHIPILRVTQILVRSLLHSSHPVDFELKAFTFSSWISLGLFYSSPSWHAEYALDFSAHVSYITAAWLLSVCTRRLVGCCLLFPVPLCSVECQCVCTRRFSDASTSLYEFLLVSASVCMSVCVCVCVRVVLSALADGPSLSSIVPLKWRALWRVKAEKKGMDRQTWKEWGGDDAWS